MIDKLQRIGRLAAMIIGGVAMTAWAQETITFDSLDTGAIISEIFVGDGVGPIQVEGINPDLGGSVNAAIIFDSSCPPGNVPSDCSGGGFRSLCSRSK